MRKKNSGQEIIVILINWSPTDEHRYTHKHTHDVYIKSS